MCSDKTLNHMQIKSIQIYGNYDIRKNGNIAADITSGKQDFVRAN